MIIQEVYEQPSRVRKLVWMSEDEKYYTQEWTGGRGTVHRNFHAFDEEIPYGVLSAVKNEDTIVTFMEDWEVLSIEEVDRIDVSWSDAPFYLCYYDDPVWGLPEEMSLEDAFKDYDHGEIVGKYVVEAMD